MLHDGYLMLSNKRNVNGKMTKLVIFCYLLIYQNLPIYKNQLFLPKACPANQPRHWDGTRKKVTIQPHFPNVAPA